MRGTLWALGAVAMMATAGCANKAPEPAAYPAPDNREAKLAYSDALRASLRKPGNPNEGPTSDDEGYVEAMARGGRIRRAEAIIENNETIRSSIATLSKADVHNCVWRELDLEEATDGTAENESEYPAYAYKCSVRVVHDTSRRGRVQADTEGYFFRDGDQFVYVGKAAHGFKKTKDIERGLI